jgi:hypothetical protein
MKRQRFKFKNVYPVDFMLKQLEIARENKAAFPDMEWLIRKQLEILFRKASDCVYVDYISEAAKAKALSIGVDLSKVVWKNQGTKGKDKGRKIFQLEHCVPISELIDRVFYTTEDLKDILKDNITAWVTYEENKKLNSKYRDTRPGGWEKCYAEFSIVPIKNIISE